MSRRAELRNEISQLKEDYNSDYTRLRSLQKAVRAIDAGEEKAQNERAQARQRERTAERALEKIFRVFGIW